MPIYEFSCEACGAEFERLQSFSDPSTPACPRCNSAQVTRQLGRPAIHFKGSGWYITDSKKSSGEGKSSSIGNGGNGTTEKSSGAAYKSGDAATGEKTAASGAATHDAGTASGEKKAETVKTAAAPAD